MSPKSSKMKTPSVVCLCALLFLPMSHGANFPIKKPSFEDGATGWSTYEFGDAGSIEWLRLTDDANTGQKAFEITARGGGGGQGIYTDVPVSALAIGDKNNLRRSR